MTEPAVAETHISTVFFAGQRAFKLLKPVKMPFLDFSTVELRRDAISNELELNRRMAPDVYLGIADVQEHGSQTDRFLVMRRMPSDRRLTAVLTHPDWQDQLRGVAKQVAQFHANQPPLRGVEPIASAAAVRANWDDNSVVLEAHAGDVFIDDDLDEVRQLYERYLGGRDLLFSERIAEGLVCDGHGDLTAEDIFCLDDGPRILDCLAFRDEYRIADVLCDIAFLAMDVERLSTPLHAGELMRCYQEFSNEHHTPSLAHHYIAYRAHVRAKIACLRIDQGDQSAATLARTYLQLCLRHLRLADPVLVLVGGGPGTGKTTLANGLSTRFGWVALNSDELRKDLTGYAHQVRATAPFGEGIYTAETTARTYETLLERAELLLKLGESVVLDATWADQANRCRASALARQLQARFVEMQCTLDPSEAKRRIERRERSEREDASDATVDIVDRALASRDAWPTAIRIDTSVDPDVAVSIAAATVRPPADPRKDP